MAEPDRCEIDNPPAAGMALRDYFAGQAITICLKDMDKPISAWAEEAYALADAMLKARAEGSGR